MNPVDRQPIRRSRLRIRPCRRSGPREAGLVLLFPGLLLLAEPFNKNPYDVANGAIHQARSEARFVEFTVLIPPPSFEAINDVLDALEADACCWNRHST